MTEEEMQEVRDQMAKELVIVEELHKELAKQARSIFGASFKLYREFNVMRNEWEWTVYAKWAGKRARFDMGISAEDVGEKFALERLLSDLPDQMQHWNEQYLTDKWEPYFAIDREDTTGIVNPGIVIWPEV